MRDKVYEKKFDEMFDRYVPYSGCAATKGGELVRAVSRIEYRFFNDGDMIGIGYGNETCNAAARFIMQMYSDTEMSNLVHSMWGLRNQRIYELGLNELVEETVDYLETNEELFLVLNNTDYQEFLKSEDSCDWDEEIY